MEVFKGNNIPGLYTRILEKILTEGIEAGPRGMKTKELSPVCMEVTNPRRRLFGHPHRKEVPIFTYIEGLWILKGEATPDRVVHYVPAMANFINEQSKVFDGAYGPRLRDIPYALYPAWAGKLTVAKFPDRIDQLELCYERLKRDPDTRQAVCIIYNPVYDWHHTKSKDIPCTLSFQFLLRNNLLDMIATMRSQDAWLGLIYDTGEFQWFQEILAGWLGVDVGRYIHIDGSLHLYERDWVKAKEVIDKDSNFSIYDKAIVYDARMSKEDFNITLNNLAIWEECSRTGNFDMTQRTVCFKNKFYKNLVSIINAYNLRLRGFKQESYEIVKGNQSDLGLIYESRWRKSA
jgi:thymidylate synthase